MFCTMKWRGARTSGSVTRAHLSFAYRVQLRTEWEDQSGKMGKLFKLDERAAVICPTLERRAEIEHDKLFGAPTLPTANTRGSEGKGERKVRKVDDEGSRGQGKVAW